MGRAELPFRSKLPDRLRRRRLVRLCRPLDLEERHIPVHESGESEILEQGFLILDDGLGRVLRNQHEQRQAVGLHELDGVVDVLSADEHIGRRAGFHDVIAEVDPPLGQVLRFLVAQACGVIADAGEHIAAGVDEEERRHLADVIENLQRVVLLPDGGLFLCLGKIDLHGNDVGHRPVDEQRGLKNFLLQLDRPVIPIAAREVEQHDLILLHRLRLRLAVARHPGDLLLRCRLTRPGFGGHGASARRPRCGAGGRDCPGAGGGHECDGKAQKRGANLDSHGDPRGSGCVVNGSSPSRLPPTPGSRSIVGRRFASANSVRDV